ncbi:hypothetical protein WR25_26414 [Diploscapter pachys]|uniref:Uncharacterized protein n=1 Tax=Diploscapter pachys TaxID=2018661 RepID=A0A2A2M4J3_9BILA|nr:hypothetical protein WR25_26414 [Diploscapter pachys]
MRGATPIPPPPGGGGSEADGGGGHGALASPRPSLLPRQHRQRPVLLGHQIFRRGRLQHLWRHLAEVAAQATDRVDAAFVEGAARHFAQPEQAAGRGAGVALL